MPSTVLLQPSQPLSANRLLGAMTRAERALVLQAAQPVSYEVGEVLFTADQEIRQVYFPESGLISLLADLPGEEAIEIGLVGREGLVGLPALLGDPVARARAMVQVATQGHCIEVATLALLAEGSRNLRLTLRQYTLAVLTHVARIAACNVAHPLEQRAARWLLQVADRVGPHIPITQEFLALMLGARRPTVNLVLRNLRAAGLVRQARGQLAIAERTALEAAACPCYGIIRRAHERVFPNAFLAAAPVDAIAVSEC
jgi:CRP-like cAMP-binding protein